MVTRNYASVPSVPQRKSSELLAIFYTADTQTKSWEVLKDTVKNIKRKD